MRCTFVDGVQCPAEGSVQYPMLGCVHEHLTPPTADCLIHTVFVMKLVEAGEMACHACREAPDGYGHECVIRVLQDPDPRAEGRVPYTLLREEA